MGLSDAIIYDCHFDRPVEPARVQASVQTWAARLALTHTPELTGPRTESESTSIGTLSDELHASCTIDNVVCVTVREEAVHRLEPGDLARLFFGLGVDLDVALGRTIREWFHMAIRQEEIAPDGALTGLGWFQYFGPRIAARWPADVWEPFRTMRGDDGAIALILGDEPLRPRIREAATALGLSIRPLYGRNPATGAPVLIPYM